METNFKSKNTEYVLKLFVSGASANSMKAINNLKKILEDNLKGAYKLEIIDVHQTPELAQQEQLIALPLLIKRLPLPERKLLGDMSDTAKVLNGLGI